MEETNNYANIPNIWGLLLQLNEKVYLSINEHNKSGYFDEVVKSRLSFGDNIFFYFNEPGINNGSYIYDLDQKIEVIASEKDQHLTDNIFNQILSTFKFIP